MELAAEPDREPELMRIRRPSLSNLGGTPGSDDHDRFIFVGRRAWELPGVEVFDSIKSDLIMGTLALTMAAAASGSYSDNS